MYYRKVAIADRLPEKMKFVTTIDSANEHRVYRLTEHGWNMRDADGAESPNNNLPMIYWLEEYTLTNTEKKAKQWDELDAEIAKCYVNEDGDELDEEESEGINLGTIGEIAASKFGWL